MKRSLSMLGLVALLFFSCKNNSSNTVQIEAQQFIDEYTSEYVKLYTNSSSAQWKSNTEIVDGDSTNTVNAQKADEAMAAFTGSKDNISNAKNTWVRRKC
jgi:peptidyl-dipeptidase A